jgi:autotransporter-associated beta strand protein
VCWQTSEPQCWLQRPVQLNGNASLGSLTGSGQVDVGIGSVLSLGSNNLSSTFAGGLNGLGGLTKVGSGTLTLTGTSNLADNTQVNAGTLKVDGTLGSNLLTVASGATLTGSGNANATVVIGNGGQLAGQSGSTWVSAPGAQQRLDRRCGPGRRLPAARPVQRRWQPDPRRHAQRWLWQRCVPDLQLQRWAPTTVWTSAACRRAWPGV